MNNKILNLAMAISQMMRSFLIFILAVVIILGIILVADSEALPFLEYQNGSFSFSTHDEAAEDTSRPEGWFLLFTFIELTLSILFSIMILNEGLKVIRSIRTLDTFKGQNIIAFRRMAYFFLSLFVVHMVSLKEGQEAFTFTFSLPLNYLFAMVGCFILAEVFKEGNRLMEENELTI